QAAREGARVASVEASHIGASATDSSCGSVAGPVSPANVPGMTADVLPATNRMMAPFAAITSSDLPYVCNGAPTAPVPPGQACATAVPNAYVSVNARLTVRPITAVISSISPAINTQASASMVIN